ncbi:hypothetical protein E8E12_002158 [Didymella heteroderae]|uniref:Uncharacterized protein n=1 Tax=Didymella heteroderae TaxID=1769908 RepID=A0A9P4WGG5_9PLEO|nr:hypothetical protein E8E12_002158 [Didymella heteroderae]
MDSASCLPELFPFDFEPGFDLVLPDPAFSSLQTFDESLQQGATDEGTMQALVDPMLQFGSAADAGFEAWSWSNPTDLSYEPALEQQSLPAQATQAPNLGDADAALVDPAVWTWSDRGSYISQPSSRQEDSQCRDSGAQALEELEDIKVRLVAFEATTDHRIALMEEGINNAHRRSVSTRGSVHD